MRLSDTIKEGTVLVEWLRDRFTRRQREAFPGEDKPRRRGLIISVCVLISVVLWFTLSLGETYPVLIEMPTVVTNLPEDTALVALPPKTVQVQLRGEGLELFRLRFNPPQFPIDAAQEEVNVATFAGLPQGVTVENVSPRLINLHKERRIYRRIPILSRVSVEPAETYDFAGEFTLSPDSIVISGAQSIVMMLDAWPTVVRRLRGVKDSLSVSIPLVDTLSGLVQRSHAATTLKVEAHQFTEGWRRLRVEVTEVPTTQLRIVQLEPSSVLVTYRVPLSQFEQAQAAQDFYATVSYSVIRADTTGHVRPEIHVPTALLLRNIEYSPSALQYYERLIEQ